HADPAAEGPPPRFVLRQRPGPLAGEAGVAPRISGALDRRGGGGALAEAVVAERAFGGAQQAGAGAADGTGPQTPPHPVAHGFGPHLPWRRADGGRRGRGSGRGSPGGGDGAVVLVFRSTEGIAPDRGRTRVRQSFGRQIGRASCREI